jgi:hypothetical protein
MIKRTVLAAALVVAVVSPVSACVSLFTACADSEMPMSPDTFSVDARAGGWLFNSSPAPALLQAASRGCQSRGYPQFLITNAQTGFADSNFRVFNVWGGRYGAYGTSASVPAKKTASAIVRCVKSGGLDVRTYSSANE